MSLIEHMVPGEELLEVHVGIAEMALFTIPF